MTKEQKQKKEIAETTILYLYKKYGHKKKETTAKAVSFFLLRKIVTKCFKEECLRNKSILST